MLQGSPVLNSPHLLVVKRVPSPIFEAPLVSDLHLLLIFRPISLAQNPISTIFLSISLPIPFFCQLSTQDLHPPVFIYLCSPAAGGHLPDGFPWHPPDRNM